MADDGTELPFDADDGNERPPGNPSSRPRGNSDRHAERAAEHFRRGQLREAEVELRKAIAGDPARGDWHFNLGLTLDAAGRLDEALGAFRAAAQRLPRQPETRLAEGAVLVRLGRHADALVPLTAATSLDPRCEPAWARRIEAHAALGQFEQADMAYYLAQQRLERMPLCLAAMGDAQLLQGKHERAAWCFREALGQAPDMARLRSKLASALAQGGARDAAARLYIEELRAHPGDVQTLIDCGDLLAAMHRVGEAIEKYRRAAELAPALAAPRARLGMLLAALGRGEAARAELETAYGLDPEGAMVRPTLAGILSDAGERVEALKVLREDVARRRDVGSESAAIECLRVAELLTVNGDAALAADLLERTHAARPDDLAVLRRLMLVSFAARRRRRARGLARRLGRLDPSALGVVQHNLALDALECFRFGLARERIRRGLAASPHDPALRRLRAAWWWRRLRSWGSR